MTEIVDCISWVVRKTFWSLGVFLKFVGLRLLDLFGLIFTIAACCTIVRLPSMIKILCNLNHHWEFWFMGFLQVLLFVLDIPIIVMAVFIFATLIRIYPMLKDMTENDVCDDIEREWNDSYFEGWKVRGYILKHFVIVFVDLFCLFFVVVCLISWRSVIFVRKFKKADGEFEKRGVIFVQFLNVLLDIPLLVCFLITCCSWRLPFVWMEVQIRVREKEQKWDRIRVVGLTNLCFMLIDIPCIIAFFVTLCTWRSPILVWQVAPHQLFNPNDYRDAQWQIRKISLLQFGYVFCDIPTFASLLLVLLTVWRMPQLVKHIKKELGESFSRSNFYKREWKMRASCFIEFGMIFVDLLSCLLGFIVFVTLWRAKPLANDIQKYRKQYKEEAEEAAAAESAMDSVSMSSIRDDAEIHGEADTEGTSTRKQSAEELKAAELDAAIQGSQPVKRVKWSHFMWKIRKKMAFHFAMLLLDIPAFPLLVLLLVTGLRASKVISALLGGQFYMLFAITVYMETLKLFRDILFILLFFVLMLMRPIAAWVHLLEDEEHREYRIISELLVWIPDICSERGKTYEEIEERLNLSIKQQKARGKTRDEITAIRNSHIRRVEELIGKLEDNEVEGELDALLKTVRYWELLRVGKMMRKYEIETSYMNRCNPTLHNDNLRKYEEEMRKYEEKVNDSYDSLLKYKPDKVPLYSSKCGLKLRTGVETRKVIIACLPRGRFITFVLMFVCTLFIYRAPRMFIRLRKKMYDRINIVFSTLKEYGKDALTMLRILLVLIFIYRAPVMLADIFDCLIEKRSWTAVRKVVKRHPPEMLKDLSHIMRKLLSWETPRFIFTMLLFGVLMPAELFLSVVRVGIQNSCLSVSITIVLYIIFMVGPFVFVLYGTEKIVALNMGWVINVAVCVFLLLLLVQLLIMIVSLARNKDKMFLLTMPKCDYVRLNWLNIHVLVFELLEFLQTLALVFKFPRIPMLGGSILHLISTYVLFSFFSYQAVFWIMVVVFIIWFFLCGAPHIFEKILDSVPEGGVGTRSSWRLALSLLSNTLFVTIIESLSTSLACTYQACPISNTTMNTTNTSMAASGNWSSLSNTTTCFSASLVEDPSIECWHDSHLGQATFALVAIVWYTTTSLIFGTEYGDPDNPHLDIGFSPIYNMIINVFKAGMVVVATMITVNQYAVLGLLIAGFLLCIFYTASFRCLFQSDPCNLRSVLVWRLCTFVSCIFAAIAVLVGFILNDEASIVPLLIFVVGTFVTFIASLIAAIKLSETSSVERDRDKFKEEIIALHKTIVANDWMHNGWKKQERTWHRLVRSVREAWKDDYNLNSEPEGEEDVAVSQDIEATPQAAVETELESPADLQSWKDEVQGEETYPGPPLPTRRYDDLPEANVDAGLKTKDSPENIKIFMPEPSPDDDSVGEDIASSPIISPTQPPPNYQSTFDALPPPSYTSAELPADQIEVPTLPTYIPPDSVLELQKNGRNLLLILEQNILYTAYNYASLSQRNVWINMVCESNWKGLLQQVQILKSSLQGTYHKPTHLDVQLANSSFPEYILGDDQRDNQSPPPAFIKKTKEQIAQESDELRIQVVDFFGNDEQHGSAYRSLVEKLLPTTPVFKSISLDGQGFTINFRRASTGVVTDFEPPGLKVAVGAQVCVGKKLCGEFNASGINFTKGCGPVGKKGPVSLGVENVMFQTKNDNLYLVANGKKVKFDIALASCKTIKWT